MTSTAVPTRSPLAILDARNGVDWDTFSSDYWDRRPVLIRNAAQPLFVSDEVFASAVAAAAPPSPGMPPPTLQLTLDRHQQTEPAPFLPQASDGSLDGYAARMARELDGGRYALVVHGFHTFHFPLWKRAGDFLSGLWERTGQPLDGGTITTLFHGNYQHSPVGVHKDRFATFMFALHGRKRMRFWPRCPWDHPVSTVLDYEPYLDTSFTAEAEPGDLLYWPADYYHVGESDLSEEPATSVNIGVPRAEHRATYDLQTYLYGSSGQLMGGTWPTRDSRPALMPPEHAGTELDGSLPPDLATALDRIEQATTADRVAERTVEHSLAHWTSNGLMPAPLPAALGELDDGDTVHATTEPRWAECGTARMCAAHGHAARTALSAEQLTALRGALRDGPHRVGELLDLTGPGSGSRADVRLLLRELVSFRALQLVPAAP